MLIVEMFVVPHVKVQTPKPCINLTKPIFTYINIADLNLVRSLAPVLSEGIVFISSFKCIF